MRFHPSGWPGVVLLISLAAAAHAGRFEILPSLFPGFQTEGVAVSADGSGRRSELSTQHSVLRTSPSNPNSETRNPNQ
jgi:hypothetical protein